MDTSRRLYRSSTSKMIAGVAGGLAEYFDIDPVIIRLVFILLAVAAGGSGIPIYIVLWIALPLKPLSPYNFGSFETGPAGATGTTFNANTQGTAEPFDPQTTTTSEGQPKGEQKEGWQNVPPPPPYSYSPANKENTNFIIGLVLIILGSLFFLGRYVHYVNFHNLWPLALVAAGAVLIVSNLKDYKKQ
jgi:phage shock protein C